MADYTTKEPLFDFKKGEFVIINGTVRTVIGKNRLENKINKVLRTQKGKYKIYENTGYGVNIKDLLVGKVYPAEFVKSEISREISEALLKDNDIVSIDNIVVSQVKEVLEVSITINSVYGQLETEGVL